MAGIQLTYTTNLINFISNCSSHLSVLLILGKFMMLEKKAKDG